MSEGVRPVQRADWTRPLALAILLFLLILVFGVPFAIMEGHPVSMAKLALVQPGMTEGQVRQILGSPTTIDRNLGGLCWTYSGWTWCVVRIRFADDNTVDEIDHDH